MCLIVKKILNIIFCREKGALKMHSRCLTAVASKGRSNKSDHLYDSGLVIGFGRMLVLILLKHPDMDVSISIDAQGIVNNF